MQVNYLTANRFFQKTIKQGTKKINSSYICFFLKNQVPFNQYGISVGKKQGSAVKRNFMKRQIRHMLRTATITQSNPKKNYNIVIMTRLGYQEKKFKQNFLLLQRLLNCFL